jgi:hypothetical protein
MNSKAFSETAALFALPTFLSGAARALDLGGTFDDYNGAASPEEADRQALKTDWAAVGKDMHLAIETLAR